MRFVIYHPDADRPEGILQETQGGETYAPGSPVKVTCLRNSGQQNYEIELEGTVIPAQREVATGDDMNVRIYYASGPSVRNS